MDNKIITILNKKYYLDLDNIMKWCLSSSNTPIKETEINEGYDTNDDGDLTMITKVIRETKANDTQSDTIRYDLMKLILVPFLGGIKTIDEIIDNFSYTLLFNTLIELGFLVEINDK